MFYENLREMWLKEERVNLLDLTPPLSTGELYFELFSEDIEATAQKMVEELGFFYALQHFASLPIALPKAIVQSVQEETKDSQALIIRYLENLGSSPLLQIHYTHLLLQLSFQSNLYLRHAQRVIHYLLSPKGKEDFFAFWALLNYIHQEVETSFPKSLFSEQVRLAITWGHCNQIFSLLHSLQLNFNDLFKRLIHILSSPYIPLTHLPSQPIDITHPKLLHLDYFLSKGLTYALESKKKIPFTKDFSKTFKYQEKKVSEKARSYQEKTLFHFQKGLANSLGSFL